jgi:hypothetical protein
MKNKVEYKHIKCKSGEYKTPCCGEEATDFDGNCYKGNNGKKYPKFISHNKKIGDITLLNFNGEYSSLYWTEIHFCNKCNVEYDFENSSI